MSLLFISPGHPAEMPFFVRGLARSGARVIGLGDQHASQLPEMAREHLAEHWEVESLDDADAVVALVRERADRAGITQVEALWDPMVLPAAQLREQLGVPGTGVARALLLRDHGRVLRALDAAGVRTPRGEDEADDVDEFTHDTICAGGRILVENVCWRRPRRRLARERGWGGLQTVALRDLDGPELEPGRRLGREVLSALGFTDGFAHTEWYRTAVGEAVFGAFAASPPGARTVDTMNFCADSDLFQRWAEAVVHGELRLPVQRRYNAAAIVKRAQGSGPVRQIDGLGALMADYGEWVMALELLPVGAPRRDRGEAPAADGMVVVRHPDLPTLLEIADRFGTELRLRAG